MARVTKIHSSLRFINYIETYDSGWAVYLTATLQVSAILSHCLETQCPKYQHNSALHSICVNDSIPGYTLHFNSTSANHLTTPSTSPMFKLA